VPPLERHPSAPLTLDLRRLPTGSGSLAGDRPPFGTEFVV
jgi:hypothetical protein